MDRIIALIDMDCFYVQVEQRLNNSLKGKPCAVVQYNAWKGGGIIAVSYEARAAGVTRQMRGDEAKKKCPEIQLVPVPQNRGKANLDKYRDAGAEIIKVLCKFSDCVERASIDEAYIDLTDVVQKRLERLQGERITFDMLPNTHVVGWDGNEETSSLSEDGSSKQGDAEKTHVIQWLENADSVQDKRLAMGGYIVEEIRAAIFEETSFRCSGGIAYNKMLAKLSCGINKPNKQTITPHTSVENLFKTLPIRKIRNLGGKLGHMLVADLNINFMGDLCQYTKVFLQSKYGDKTGLWLYEICRGLEYETVKQRTLPKSIGCSKNFTGNTALDTKDKVVHWMKELAQEVSERIEKDQEMNNRVPKQMTISLKLDTKPASNVTRSCALSKTEAEDMTRTAYSLIQSLNTAGNNQAAWVPHVLCLGIATSKFTENVCSGNMSMKNFLSSPSKTTNLHATSPHFSSQKKCSKSIETFFSSVKNTSDEDAKLPMTKYGDSGFCANADESLILEPKEDSEINKQQLNKKLTKGIQQFFTPKSRLSDKDCEENIDVMSTKLQDNSSSNINKVSISGESLHKEAKEIDAKLIDNQLNTENIDSVNNGLSCSKISLSSNSPSSSKSVILKSLPYLPTKSISSKSSFHSPPPTSKSLTAFFSQNTKRKSAGFTDKHSTELNTDEISSDNSDEIKCKKCCAIVSAWDYPEHLDYHFAMDLHKEIQDKMTTPPICDQASTTPRSAGNKSKRTDQLSASAKKKKPNDKSSIASFFKKSWNSE
ncbi:DNA polymerase eta-like [Antedon mediterranea]|uniref:DNA polymerase eta-like n=1 Tax=Antedon mediterranea TaxID=105859 RepID=UPI003AF8D1A0